MSGDLHGNTFVILWVIWVALLPLTWALGIWVVIDALRRSEQDFDEIGSSRALWIILPAVLSISFVPAGLTCSLIYLLRVRPKLKG